MTRYLVSSACPTGLSAVGGALAGRIPGGVVKPSVRTELLTEEAETAGCRQEQLFPNKGVRSVMMAAQEYFAAMKANWRAMSVSTL